jgi:hypothetical protein
MLDKLLREVFSQVLCILRDAYDGTRASALDISNLAQTSRSIRDVITWWTRAESHSEKGMNALVELSNSHLVWLRWYRSAQVTCPIPVYCRKLWGICATCKNRARYSKGGEYFTGRQLCRGCESRYFPKMSQKLLERNFDVSTKGKEVPDGLETYSLEMKNSGDLATDQQPQEKRIFRWCDVKEHISPGLLTWDMSEMLHRFQHISGEECAYFGNIPVHIFRNRWLLQRLILWEDANDHWNPQRQKLSPARRDMILFNEFIYQFDRSFRYATTTEEDFKRYVLVARYWARPGPWEERPWGKRKFPLPPHSTDSEFMVSEGRSEGRMALQTRAYWLYQRRCEMIRTFFRLFPKILCCPSTWEKYVERYWPGWVPYKAMVLAEKAARRWRDDMTPVRLQFTASFTNARDIWCTALDRRTRRNLTHDRNNDVILVDGHHVKEIWTGDDTTNLLERLTLLFEGERMDN